jgi:hypothetical protein
MSSGGVDCCKYFCENREYLVLVLELVVDGQ